MTREVTRPPPDRALKAYRLSLIKGETQAEIAKALQTNQGQVSRDITRVTDWVAAGNVLPDLDFGKPKIINKSPKQLIAGNRTDNRRPAPRSPIQD